MSKPVLCRLVKIDFQALRNLMIRNRIYADDACGKPQQVKYSYVTARQLYSSLLNGSESKVYIRTDGIY